MSLDILFWDGICGSYLPYLAILRDFLDGLDNFRQILDVKLLFVEAVFSFSYFGGNRAHSKILLARARTQSVLIGCGLVGRSPCR